MRAIAESVLRSHRLFVSLYRRICFWWQFPRSVWATPQPNCIRLSIRRHQRREMMCFCMILCHNLMLSSFMNRSNHFLYKRGGFLSLRVWQWVRHWVRCDSNQPLKRQIWRPRAASLHHCPVGHRSTNALMLRHEHIGTDHNREIQTNDAVRHLARHRSIRCTKCLCKRWKDFLNYRLQANYDLNWNETKL